MKKVVNTEKQKKSYIDIVNEINSLEYTGKIKSKVLTKIPSLLFEIGKLSDRVTKSNLENLFDTAYLKFGDDEYKFLLRILMLLVKVKSNTCSSNQLNNFSYLYELTIEYSKNALIKIDYSNDELDRLSSYQLSDYRNDPDLMKSVISHNSEKSTKSNVNISRERICSLIYVYLIVRNMRRPDFQDLSLYLERTLSEEVTRLTKKSVLTHLWSDVPKILIAKNPRSQLEKMTFMYFGLSNENLKIQSEKDYVFHRAESLNEKVSSLTLELKQMQNQLDSQTITIESLKNEINAFSVEKAKMNSILQFEKNKYDMQYTSLKESLKYKLKKLFELEIQGIEDIVQNYPEKEKAMLQRRISNIHQIINTLGEK